MLKRILKRLFPLHFSSARINSEGIFSIPAVKIQATGKSHDVVLKMIAGRDSPTFEIISITPPAPAMGVASAPSLTFRCNVCGNTNHDVHLELVKNREAQSCGHCGSSLRMRSIVHVLSMELFGKSMVLPDFPHDPGILGAGMSDWDGYALPLSKKLGYTNTFYHKEPRLDIMQTPKESDGRYDFLISSDVFEHIPPPVSVAFVNARKLLKPDGVLIFTVPYKKEGESEEYFPELYDFRIATVGDKQILINVTRDGVEQIFDNLVFHGGDGFTLEMRLLSEGGLLQELENAGFEQIKIYDENCPEYGIVWPISWALPIAARPRGSSTRFHV